MRDGLNVICLSALLLVGCGGGGDAGGGGPGGTPTTVTINFDELPGSTMVTNQYPAVTFSSIDPDVARVFAYATYCQTSPSNELCVGTANNCTKTAIMQFTNPADNLRFRLGCTDSSAAIATARVFQGATMSTVSIDGTGVATTPKQVDLSAFRGITRLEVTPTGVDAEGYGFDDISFDTVE
jgi:hypothetical protein